MGLRHDGPSERPELNVTVRLNHITVGMGEDYSTLVVTDNASSCQVLSVKLTPKQLYDMLANRDTGFDGVPADWISPRVYPWIGQKAWYFKRTLGRAWNEDDPAVLQWAEDVRQAVGLHTADVRAYNYGTGVNWSVHSNSVTEDTAALYQQAIDSTDLPPESKR